MQLKFQQLAGTGIPEKQLIVRGIGSVSGEGMANQNHPKARSILDLPSSLAVRGPHTAEVGLEN